MAALTFPIGKDGLMVPVFVGLKGEVVADLVAKGLPIPPPIECRGVVDTGSSATAVVPWVLKGLGLGQGIPAKSQTVAGEVGTFVHWISLSVLDPNTGRPAYTMPTVLVSELKDDFSIAEVLIGLNALTECNLLLEGPAQQFSFLF
ncbi:MAG: hypothetical protein HY289_09935 [Planctomycetes bacterium]|nr:hypothetical protein [Planctomycetota bacterium]